MTPADGLRLAADLLEEYPGLIDPDVNVDRHAVRLQLSHRHVTLVHAAHLAERLGHEQYEERESAEYVHHRWTSPDPARPVELVLLTPDGSDWRPEVDLLPEAVGL